MEFSGVTRTVREHRADGPQPSSKQSVKRNGTTRSAPRNVDSLYPTHGLSKSNLCRADGLRPPSHGLRPPSDSPPNLLPQNFGTSKYLRASSQELDEHTKNSHLADGPWAIGGQFDSPRTEQPEVKTEKTTSPIPPWISQTARALEERFGENVKRP
jgi:hypothetical protein